MKDHDHRLQLSLQRKLAGWLVHALTASGAYVGLLALSAIYQGNYLSSLWFMCLAIVIDSVDGMFARLINVKVAAPKIDGALLDNIVDFLNYTIVPCFFLLVTDLIPEAWRHIGVAVVVFSSAYQFTQHDAKTPDHFFKGFPSFWNIAVFYLFFWQMGEWVNLALLFLLALLSFVPIKYIYPSRLEYLAKSYFPRLAMLLATLGWGLATVGLLWMYPTSNQLLVMVSMGYMVLYVGASLYRTWVPILTSAGTGESFGELASPIDRFDD